jgi:hypothetical protein
MAIGASSPRERINSVLGMISQLLGMRSSRLRDSNLIDLNILKHRSTCGILRNSG